MYPKPCNMYPKPCNLYSKPCNMYSKNFQFQFLFLKRLFLNYELTRKQREAVN